MSRTSFLSPDTTPFVSDADQNPTLPITALGWRTSEYIADQVRELNVKEDGADLRCAYFPSGSEVTNQLYFFWSVRSSIMMEDLVKPDGCFAAGIWALP
jgi:hypothetical protein